MSSAAQPALASRLRVLMAGEDRVTLTHMSDLLGKMGYDLEVVESGTQALQALESDNPPPLAVLDWRAPELSGIEICRRVPAERRHSTYIILLVPWNQRSDCTLGLEAGADDCVFKPVDVRELRLRMQIGAQILLERAHKTTAEALRRSDALFRAISLNVADLMLLCDLNLMGLHASESFRKELGIDPEQVLGADCRQIIHPDDLPMVERLTTEMIRTGGSRTAIIRCPHKNGTWIHVESTATLLRNPAGAPEGFIVVSRPIEDRLHAERKLQEAEDQLRQAQKLEAIGQLAAGIAHEINTPTQFVGDNTRFLKESWDSIGAFFALCGELRAQAREGSISAEMLQRLDQTYEQCDLDYLMREIPQALEQSLEGLQRVTQIVRGMKEFSHPGTGEKHAVNLNRAIETTITVSHHEWKYCAELIPEFDETLPPVPCLLSEFNQVVLNLIINAAHAIVAAQEKNQQHKGLIRIVTSRDGRWARVAISDNGTGIPPEIRGRVFEPFFTTKDVGKGTGQGLALAHSVVVNRHQGEIWFESEVGQGTTFFVRLPLK